MTSEEAALPCYAIVCVYIRSCTEDIFNVQARQERQEHSSLITCEFAPREALSTRRRANDQ